MTLKKQRPFWDSLSRNLQIRSLQRKILHWPQHASAKSTPIRNQSRVDLAPGIVTLRTLVDECLTITRSRLIGIEVELCFEESAVVQVIRSQFGQVLINLISNAADAIGEVKGKAKSGQIRLSAKVEDKTLREFTIEDSGPGIPEDVREKILNPFTTKEVGKELGLGCPLSCAFLTFMDSLIH